MVKHTTYRFNKRPYAYVDTHESLPVITPTKGKTYRAYRWCNEKEDYIGGCIAVYQGNGEWSDPFNPGSTAYIESMPWADYIEEFNQ